MSKIQQTDSEIRVNKPVHLFTLKGPNGKAKKYETPIISIDAVDAWYDAVEKVAEAERAVKKAAGGNLKEMIEAKKVFAAALFDAICSYNPKAIPKKELAGKLSVLQATAAFMRLRELSDPFDQLQLGFSKALKDQVDGVDPEVIEAMVHFAKMETKSKVDSDTPEPPVSSE